MKLLSVVALSSLFVGSIAVPAAAGVLIPDIDRTGTSSLTKPVVDDINDAINGVTNTVDTTVGGTTVGGTTVGDIVAELGRLLQEINAIVAEATSAV